MIVRSRHTMCYCVTAKSGVYRTFHQHHVCDYNTACRYYAFHFLLISCSKWHFCVRIRKVNIMKYPEPSLVPGSGIPTNRKLTWHTSTVGLINNTDMRCLYNIRMTWRCHWLKDWLLQIKKSSIFSNFETSSKYYCGVCVGLIFLFISTTCF